MAFTVVLIALLLQRFLATAKVEVPVARWYGDYYGFLKQRWHAAGFWQPWPVLLLVVLPLWFVLSLLFSLTYHWFGLIFYYVLSLAIVWYSIDARRLNVNLLERKNTEQVLITHYHPVFVVVFWYAFFGLSGLVLFLLVAHFRALLERQTAPLSSTEQSLLNLLNTLLNWMAWPALRLLGFTYALIGHFAPTFTYWRQHLFTGIAEVNQQTVNSLLTSLDWPHTQAHETLTAERLTILEGYMERAMIVWLVVLALLALGSIVG